MRNVRIGQRHFGVFGLSLKRMELVGVVGFSRERVKAARGLLWAA